MRRGKLLFSGLLLPIVLISLSLSPQPALAGSAMEHEQLQREAQSPVRQPLKQALLSESFDGVTFPPDGWGTSIVSGTDQGWSRQTSSSFPTASPRSGLGMARFFSWFLLPGDSTRLYTPVLNLSGQTTPTLQFWMYHNTDASTSNDRIQIQISTNGGGSYPTTLDTVSRYDGSTGWKQHTIDLSAYGEQTNVRLGFLGISAFGNSILIDDVHVGAPIILKYVYLPFIILPPLVPPDGHYTGTTSRGQPMSFDVSGNGTVWSNFTLKTDFVIGSCSGTIEKTILGPNAITSNQFSYSGSTYSFSGQLNSLTTASGSYSFVNESITNCGLLTQSGTWTAQSP